MYWQPFAVILLFVKSRLMTEEQVRRYRQTALQPSSSHLAFFSKIFYVCGYLEPLKESMRTLVFFIPIYSYKSNLVTSNPLSICSFLYKDMIYDNGKIPALVHFYLYLCMNCSNLILLLPDPFYFNFLKVFLPRKCSTLSLSVPFSLY
jgi:hypothetical protein